MLGPVIGPVHDEARHWIHLVGVHLVGLVVGPVRYDVRHCVHPIRRALLLGSVVGSVYDEARHCVHPVGGALLLGPVVGPDLRIHCDRCHHHRIGTEEWQQKLGCVERWDGWTDLRVPLPA